MAGAIDLYNISINLLKARIVSDLLRFSAYIEDQVKESQVRMERLLLKKLWKVPERTMPASLMQHRIVYDIVLIRGGGY